MKKETIPENTGSKQEIKRDDKGRFPPGVSGNPAGKPIGTKHLSTKLFAALENLTEGGKSYSDLLVQRILNDAIVKGNTSMIHLVMNYIDGMPQQGLDLTSGGEKLHTQSSEDVMAIAKKVSEELKKRKT